MSIVDTWDWDKIKLSEDSCEEESVVIPSAKDGECNCFETDDKWEYWGYWYICDCGFSNTESAKYCGGCGKKINVVGVTEDSPNFMR